MQLVYYVIIYDKIILPSDTDIPESALPLILYFYVETGSQVRIYSQ